MLEDPSQAGRGYALSQVWRRGPKKDGKSTNFDGYSIRTQRWRYTEWEGGKRGRELYDPLDRPQGTTQPRQRTDYGRHRCCAFQATQGRHSNDIPQIGITTDKARWDMGAQSDQSLTKGWRARVSASLNRH